MSTDVVSCSFVGCLSHCRHLGKYNKGGHMKVWCCNHLPVKFITKPIGEWMCVFCR